MDSADTPSTAPVDLGSENNTRPTRTHPPRLQHSPSLPNIWFPPHSGPIPPQFEALSRNVLQRPSTPPPVESMPISSGAGLLPHKKTLGHCESLSLDDIPSKLPQTKPLNIQRRRKVDREQRHGYSLLTPPLTPSSSLKTNASSDSTGNADATSDVIPESRRDEADYRSTRFLLLGNISKQVRHDFLRAAIVGSLISPRVGTPNAPKELSAPIAANMGQLTEDAIKGVFLRCQQSRGIVMLAFFDVRHAEIANELISTPTTGSLSQCVGNDLAADGTRSWITCHFIAADELAEVIGNSPFLTSTDASFYLIVEDIRAIGYDREQELRIVDNRSVHDGSDPSLDEAISSADGEPNLNLLKSFLNSFGAIRSFVLSKDKFDPSKPRAKFFRVEYFDVREAISVYTAVQGQVLFGMKLRVFGRQNLMDTANCKRRSQDCSSTQITMFDAKNQIPFPTNTNEQHTQFGPPGQYSQTRERFQIVENTYTRTRAPSNGQNLPVEPISGSPAPSPTFFYTSDPADHRPTGSSSNDTPNYPSSEDAVYNTSVGQYAAADNYQDKFNTHSLEREHELSDGCQVFRGVEAYSSRTPGFHPHPDCYYCPSRGSPSSGCYAPCSTPSPFFYHFDQRLPAPHSVPLVPPPHVYGYAQENSYVQPVAPVYALTNFEHALTSPPDHWVPEAPSMVNPTIQSYYTPQPPIPGCSDLSCVNKHDVHMEFSPPLNGPPNFCPSASHLSDRSGRPPPSHGHPGGGRETRTTVEHNQLNIGRIEDGQDTRTTVMIKNIPNKMSDRDLIAYIGTVCPRKIDFLYLRMDFQNGCNVGYAFVNFITVQDLLTFAKARLGVKWNLFSSEKVLQMSYANYQGKEALVEKFKNSCIMDEKEAWRPKIFYSEYGPEQGLPELFPSPTHIRRKERSAFNRGALFVPGVGRGTVSPQSVTHSRRLEDTRKASGRHSPNRQATTGVYPLIDFPRH